MDKETIKCTLEGLAHRFSELAYATAESGLHAERYSDEFQRISETLLELAQCFEEDIE